MQKLIKLNPEHYIIINDSEIKEGDWVYQPMTNAVYKTSRIDNSDIGYKITHSTQPLELLTLSKNGLSGIGFSKVKPLNIFNVKELIGEVNVEKKAELYVWGGVYLTEQEKQQTEIAYMIGYNQALEDNKDKKYTEGDLRYLLNLLTYDDLSEDEKIESCIEYIKDLLQTKTEWEVEIVNGKFKLK